MDVAHLNELIATFGDHHKAELRREGRAGAVSPLFDMPRRSLLGWYLKRDVTAEVMREVVARASPEELGRRMKAVGARPYYMQLFLLFHDVLGSRQQRLLESGLQEGDRWEGERLDDLLFVADVWERTCRVYRNDGGLFPTGDRSQPVLEEGALVEVEELLRPFDAAAHGEARRLLATLDGYAFLAHGEQRDGIFGHGPYARPDGTTLFFKEVNDLANDLLPWAQTPTRNRYGNVAFAFAARDVRVECDFFSSLVTDPLDPADRIERFAVLRNDRGVVRAVDEAEWREIAEDAAAATTEMYETIIGWDARQRASYGSLLFANHLKPFCDLVGIDANDRLAAAAAENDRRYLDEVLAGPDVPLSIRHWTTATGNLDWLVTP